MKFQRTIGIDYSGAETADSSLKGLRVYRTDDGGPALEVSPPPGPKKYWTRRALANWLIATLSEPVPTIVGIGHGFSFPEAYFKRYGVLRDWDSFLEDFQNYWPTDAPSTYVDFLLMGRKPTGLARSGDPRWRRHTELACRAKSLFQFEGQGQVATATHAGIPFLRLLRRALPALHFWPFDGWEVPAGRSCVAEAYPRLCSGTYPTEDRTPDQQDAYATALWLRDAGADGRLQAALSPELRSAVRKAASFEGWILGVTNAAAVSKPAKIAGKPKASDRGTTTPGYRNRNGQIVIRATGHPGTDHNQQVYQLACERCGLNYGANGSDIHGRKCPACGGGRPGLVL